MKKIEIRRGPILACFLVKTKKFPTLMNSRKKPFPTNTALS
jgi:hypothetical protein